MSNDCMQKVCDIRLFNVEYLAKSDISINTHTHTGKADLLTSINIRGHPRVNIRLFLQKCKGSLNVFCPCTNDYFQNLHL